MTRLQTTETIPQEDIIILKTTEAKTINLFTYLEGSWAMEGVTKFKEEDTAGLGKINCEHRYNDQVCFLTKDYDINGLGFSW